MTEGSRAFRAQIDKLVKQRTKLHIGDLVRTKHGDIGEVDSISSQTDIKDIRTTKVMYLVRIRGTNMLYGFYFEELKLLTTPEKVNFT
jgi:hypothetical protein